MMINSLDGKIDPEGYYFGGLVPGMLEGQNGNGERSPGTGGKDIKNQKE